MITIRNEQMHVLQQTAAAAFQRRAAQYLNEQHPEQTSTLTEEVLDGMVGHGMTLAQSYGFKWQSSMIAFLELMLLMAPNFDRVPAIANRLRDRSGDEGERMVRITQDTTFSEWQQAAKDYDPSAWGVDVNAHPALLELQSSFPVR